MVGHSLLTFDVTCDHPPPVASGANSVQHCGFAVRRYILLSSTPPPTLLLLFRSLCVSPCYAGTLLCATSQFTHTHHKPQCTLLHMPSHFTCFPMFCCTYTAVLSLASCCSTPRTCQSCRCFRWSPPSRGHHVRPQHCSARILLAPALLQEQPQCGDTGWWEVGGGAGVVGGVMGEREVGLVW